MPISDSFAVHSAFDRTASEPFELGSVQWIRRPGEGDRQTLTAGYWMVTPEEAPEPFDLISDEDETIYIIEGRLQIFLQESGAVLDLRPGSSASINRGVAARWTIIEPVVEFFVYS